MAKLILMSIIIGMIWIPVRLSTEPDSPKTRKKLIKQMMIFAGIYLFALRFLWGRFS